MEKVKIDVCVRPYFHDVIDTVTRKPKYNKNHDKHYVRYKGKNFPIVKGHENYVIWIEENDREKYQLRK